MQEPSYHLEAVVKSRDEREDFTGPLDLILMLLAKNKIEIRDIQISLLLDHAGIHRDVADPWYTGDFEATWNDVLTGCSALLQIATA